MQSSNSTVFVGSTAQYPTHHQQQQAILTQLQQQHQQLQQLNNSHQQQQQHVVTSQQLQQSQPQQQQQQKDTTYTKIFVGGLPYHTTDESLKVFFQKFGNIEEAVVITDRTTGKSRGYGFVTMETIEAAELAVLDPNPIIDGRKANVNLAYLGVKSRLVQPTGFIPVSIGRYPLPPTTTAYGFPHVYYQPTTNLPTTSASFHALTNGITATTSPANFLLSHQSHAAPQYTTNPQQALFDLSAMAAAGYAAAVSNSNRTSPFDHQQHQAAAAAYAAALNGSVMAASQQQPNGAGALSVITATTGAGATGSGGGTSGAPISQTSVNQVVQQQQQQAATGYFTIPHHLANAFQTQ